MPRYIDAEALTRDLIDNRSFYPAIVKNAIENAPAADVVSKSEYEQIKTDKDNLIKFYAECMKEHTSAIFEEIRKYFAEQSKDLKSMLEKSSNKSFSAYIGGQITMLDKFPFWLELIQKRYEEGATNNE